MALILYENGKKIGEISDWVLIPDTPTYKTFLGKTVLAPPAKDICTFTSPKPINRKSKLIVIESGKSEFNLEIKTVRGSTAVTATIISMNKV